MGASPHATLIDNYSLREEAFEVTGDVTHESIIAMVLHIEPPLIVACEGPLRNEVLTPVGETRT